MILSDRSIREEMALHFEDRLVVTPLHAKAIQPASIDIRLGSNFITFEPEEQTETVDPDVGLQYHWVADVEEYVIKPGQFILGTTLEYVKVPRWLVARIEGKSSLGRLGLLVHATAGFVDPGFRGNLTLELFNASCAPIRLKLGMFIAQLAIERLDQPAEIPYGSPELGSRYQNQRGTVASRYGRA